MTMTPTDRLQECKYYKKYARSFFYNLCAKCGLPMKLCGFYNNPTNCPDFTPKTKEKS